MSLGAWIFAAVVLVLLVINTSFRKFFLRAAGVLAALAVIAGVCWYAWDKHQQHAALAALEKCKARFTTNGWNGDGACQMNPDIEAPPRDLPPGKFVDSDGVMQDIPAPPPGVDYDALAKKYGGTPVHPKPKPEPTNFQIRVDDGSYVKDGQRVQGYIAYTCVNTDTGEVMPVTYQVSPSWEVNEDKRGYSSWHPKQFADRESAEAYAKRAVTAACKQWVSK